MGGGAFAEWQPRYAEVGIATFPVRGKTPAVTGYLRLRLAGSRRLVDRFPGASAFGLALKPSGITVIDVDAPDELLLADALGRHGNTPFIVRSGSGHFQAWYRRQDEGRCIRPDPGTPIDILGDGFVVAPPSAGEKGRYEIISGSLADLPLLPRLRNPPIPVEPVGSRIRASGASVGEGRRNTTLWRHCMGQAHYCDDLGALVDVARTANAYCLPPLGDDEVFKVARSAWGYTERGQNRMGRQYVRIEHRMIDELLAADPDAYVLLSLLLRHHADRSRFYVANAMAETMPPHGWALKRFRAARARLLGDAMIVRVRNASSMYGAAVYAWGARH